MQSIYEHNVSVGIMHPYMYRRSDRKQDTLSFQARGSSLGFSCALHHVGAAASRCSPAAFSPPCRWIS